MLKKNLKGLEDKILKASKDYHYDTNGEDHKKKSYNLFSLKLISSWDS